MGVLGCVSERMAQTYFFQTRRDTREAELLAVVVQRFLSPLVTRTPRNISSLFKRRPAVVPAAGPTPAQMGEWTSMSDFGQKTEVCFSAERGLQWPPTGGRSSCYSMRMKACRGDGAWGRSLFMCHYGQSPRNSSWTEHDTSRSDSSGFVQTTPHGRRP